MYQPLAYAEALENLLLKCKSKITLLHALRIHDYMKECGLETHSLLGNSLVLLLVHVKRVSTAENICCKLPNPQESLWNALIVNHAQQGDFCDAISLYKRLSENSLFQPNEPAFVALLKACASINDLNKGFQIYQHVQQRRLHFTNEYIASALVDMFAKFECLEQAQEVFDQLSERTVVLWNTLITHYTNFGNCEHVLSCFEQMEREELSANAVTYLCGLRACGSLGVALKGWRFYLDIVKKGLDENVVVGSTLVDMFAKCGCLLVAQDVFNKLPTRNVVSWNALITGFSDHGQTNQVLCFSEKMQSEYVSANAITLVCFLKACGYAGLIEKGQDFHTELVLKGLENDLRVGCSLIDVYAKWRSLDIAQYILDRLPNQDVAIWNALIMGYADLGYGQDALKCFQNMRCNHLTPNSATYVCVLKACIRMNAMNDSSAMHMDITKIGLETNSFVGSSLVDMYAKAGLMLESKCVFDNLPVQSAVVWNALVAGYSENQEDYKVFDCLGEMQDNGISADETTLVCALKACGNGTKIAEGKKIHSEVIKKGYLEKDSYVGSTLVDVYISWHMLLEAQLIFDNLTTRNKFSYIALLLGYVEWGCIEDAFNLFESIQCTSVKYDPVIFTCILRAAASTEALQRGQYLHNLIVKYGLERDIIVITNLVDMYAKCGYLEEVQQMSKSELISDFDTWTALINGNFEHVDSEAALNFFEKMQEAKVSPGRIAFLVGIKACGNLGATVEGRKLHTALVKNGFEKDPFFANALIEMLAKLCLLDEAFRVFERVMIRDVAVWNALITAYVDHQAAQEAVTCFEQMCDHGVSANEITLVGIVKACGFMCWIRKAQDVYSEIMRKGLEREPFVGSVMIDVYAKCGFLFEANEVFMKSSIHRIVSWNALIKAYMDAGHIEEALHCYEQMQQEQISADIVTFVSCLKGCGAKEFSKKGCSLYCELTKKGLDEQIPIGNVLIDMYSKCCMLMDAQKVFVAIRIPNVVSYSALIGGYVSCGRDEEALFFLEQMQQERIALSTVSYIWGLKACGNFQVAKKGHELHSDLIKKGVIVKEPNVGSILAEMYTNFGLFDEAQCVFVNLPERDSVSWTSLIARLSERGFHEKSLILFEEMKMAAASPDASTLACILNACGIAGATCKAKEIHEEIVEKGFDGEPFIGDVLICAYSQCGLLTMAQEVFAKLHVRDSSVWNALIGGYAHFGECHTSFELFKKMVLEGNSPDENTFVNLITACNHVGMLEGGLACLTLMSNEYVINSTIDHFFCMLDLLGRAGCMSATAIMISEMPFQPHNMLWLSVIGACKKWGIVGLAKLAFDNAVSLDENKAATYIGMSNIYADATMDEKAFKIAAL